MRHPIQWLASRQSHDQPTASILLAACGSHLYSFDLLNGSLVSQWSSAPGIADGTRKSENSSSSDAAEKRRDLLGASANNSYLLKLEVTQSGDYVAAITAEDKCAHVFALNSNGKLCQLSERHLPKRPCVLAIIDGGKQIVYGDKFGDVYGLPLLEDSNKVTSRHAERESDRKKVFRPSANEFTIHTERNRRALEAQLKQAAQPNTICEKKPEFQYEILLGHVSMLTDLKYIEVIDVLGDAPKKRTYLITSDRDEHIRVSRGPPQSYITEAYCLGHTEFVSIMCVLSEELLISGGGDDALYLWKWQDGRLVRTIDLRKHIQRLKASNDRDDKSVGQIADASDITVSGLWKVPGRTSEYDILAICEGVPALFIISGSGLSVTSETKNEVESIKLEGNPICVTVLEGKIIVALDGFCAAWSTRTPRHASDKVPRLVGYSLGEAAESTEETFWKPDPALQSRLNAMDQLIDISVIGEQVPTFLYGINDLRKQRRSTNEAT